MLAPRALSPLVVSLFVVACASFGRDETAPDTKQASSTGSPSEASSGADGAGSGGADADAGAQGGDGGAPSRSLACGDSICTGPGGCCVTPQGPICTSTCTSLYFTCLGAADCATGEVCCSDGRTAACTKSCAGTIVCKTSDECGSGGSCDPQSCGGSFAFSACSNATNSASVIDCAAH